MNVVKMLPGHGWVTGVTCTGDELFVLYQRQKKEQVEVYSTKTSDDFRRLRFLSFEGLAKHRHNDITSFVQGKCVRLYISDHENRCIHKSALDGKVTDKWPVFNKPCGLSLTTNNNLLVTCYNYGEEIGELVEFSGESGECIRRVDLDQSIAGRVYHAVELHGDGPSPTLHYVFSQSYDGDARSKVSVIDADGQVSLNYENYADAARKLVLARHLAVDRHNFVFVADREGGRRNTGVVLLSPGLQFVRRIELEEAPTRLYLDHVTRRLYVGQLGGVTVVQV